MSPKQTSPLGNTPGGGQEGQVGQPANSVGGNSASPVFSSGTATAGAHPTSPDAAAVTAGTLGSETLSTGANVSRTMDSLNSNNKSATSSSPFAKHKFDRAEPDGAIIIPTSGERVSGGREEPLERRKQLRIMGIVGAVVAVVLLIGIVAAFVLAPKKVETKEIDRGAVADEIENNVNLDAIDDLEFFYKYMERNKNLGLTNIYVNDEASLMQEYGSAFDAMSSLSKKLKDSANIASGTLSSRMRTFASFIDNRSAVYQQTFELMDEFHEAIVDGLKNDNRKLTELFASDDDDVKKLAQKVQTSILAPNAAENYLRSNEPVAGVLAIVANPIDYDTEGEIYDRANLLVYDLRNGTDEEVFTVPTTNVVLDNTNPLPIVEIFERAAAVELGGENE